MRIFGVSIRQKSKINKKIIMNQKLTKILQNNSEVSNDELVEEFIEKNKCIVAYECDYVFPNDPDEEFQDTRVVYYTSAENGAGCWDILNDEGIVEDNPGEIFSQRFIEDIYVFDSDADMWKFFE